MNSIPILWVELGRRLPRHLKNNIQFHGSSFPHIQQFLITDQRIPKKLSSFCKFINSRDLVGLEIDDLLERRINRNTRQASFWINTTKRFFIIQEFMNTMKIENLIHLESDCLLLRPDLVFEHFRKDKWTLAYPFQASNIGCASILLVKGVDGITNFNNFVIEKWSEKNQDDMKLLGEFASNNEVMKLSSIPETKEVYDPQIYGRYLLGTDARNVRFPFSRRGVLDIRAGAVNPADFTYRWNKNSCNLYISSSSKDSCLVNLHIHSKRVPKDWKRLSKLVSRDIGKIGSKKWERGQFDFQIFIERSFSWFARNILKKNIDFRIR